LIPFLEHDDANRALMGSNMQRVQAVPLYDYPSRRWWARRLEQEAALNSSMLVRAQRKGVITAVDAEHIEIGADVYKLRKFVGSQRADLPEPAADRQAGRPRSRRDR